MLKKFIRDIPDFPKKGIVFKDITPLLNDTTALKRSVYLLCEPYLHNRPDVVVGVEARGFIFGCAVACELGAGFVPIRKPGKLPYETASASYDLEYGTDTIEMHVDAIKKGANVLMVDDLLATGGTMAAACELVRNQGGNIIGVSFLVELAFLNGREKLGDYDIRSLITYD
ncbi:MAG: adenine phosphoribosyltransferase [Planctomycetota bacterium]|nr:MAG: adenine phosphoribosyltransferase [Planctomycetota bacterium]